MVDLIIKILAVIILLFGIYSFFRTKRYDKELDNAIKENSRSINKILRKQNRLTSIELILLSILLIIYIYRGQ